MHTLRHTFATRCLEHGIGYEVLSELLGHSSPQITLKFYVHCTPATKRKSMDQLLMIMDDILELVQWPEAEFPRQSLEGCGGCADFTEPDPKLDRAAAGAGNWQRARNGMCCRADTLPAAHSIPLRTRCQFSAPAAALSSLGSSSVKSVHPPQPSRL